MKVKYECEIAPAELPDLAKAFESLAKLVRGGQIKPECPLPGPFQQPPSVDHDVVPLPPTRPLGKIIKHIGAYGYHYALWRVGNTWRSVHVTAIRSRTGAHTVEFLDVASSAKHVRTAFNDDGVLTTEGLQLSLGARGDSGVLLFTQEQPVSESLEPPFLSKDPQFPAMDTSHLRMPDPPREAMIPDAWRRFVQAFAQHWKGDPDAQPDRAMLVRNLAMHGGGAVRKYLTAVNGLTPAVRAVVGPNAAEEEVVEMAANIAQISSATGFDLQQYLDFNGVMQTDLETKSTEQLFEELQK